VLYAFSYSQDLRLHWRAAAAPAAYWSLGQNYQSLNVTLIDDFGNRISGNALQLVADPNGPHPYNSDFYYQSGFGALQSGMTYTAELTVANVSTFNSCAYTLQSFRT
jgi:hypothetical protein